ncbi:MAG: DUF6273 domain-containing protein [Lachnospiraceae bacterium]|nr:DUF6273 domain-containing protein [Lachnospiraceae bacterium]
MGNSLVDLFKAETEFDVKASEMYGLMREAVKAEFLLNAVKCDIPHTYARQIATGEKEDAPFIMAGIDLSAGKDWTPGQQDGDQEQAEENAARAAGQDVRSGSGSVGIIRKHEQRVEWIDIQDIIRKGRAGASLPPGTEINFTLQNGDQASAVVVGVDHYEKGDCVFWFRKIVGRHCMNKDDTNKGGFPGADAMREYLEEVYSLLPDELQSVIALHKTVQKIDGEKVECEGRLFLMSLYEGRGSNDWAEYNGTDKQFPYFEDRRNRIAYDDDGDPVWYWTADPSAAYTTAFCNFNASGHSYSFNASADGGVAPLFVIK